MRMVIVPDMAGWGWSVSRMELGDSGVRFPHSTEVPVTQVSSVYASPSSCEPLQMLSS